MLYLFTKVVVNSSIVSLPYLLEGTGLPMLVSEEPETSPAPHSLTSSPATSSNDALTLNFEPSNDAVRMFDPHFWYQLASGPALKWDLLGIASASPPYVCH